MNVAIAIDSFKGCLTTFQAGEAISKGIKRVFDDAIINVCPLADGGEGTVSAIVAATGGDFVEVTVHDPLGNLIKSGYGIIPQSKTAVIEMALASGLTLVKKEERNPLYTTTYGVGELINDAISKGCRKFIIGIGGSATNDGGVGMLQALGFEFLDKMGNQVPFGAIGLKDIVTIKTDNVPPVLKECEFNVACDVTNVLCGDQGCSAVFGAQKGAIKQMIDDMDAWLNHYARLTKNILPTSDKNKKGCGAAGGLGFAFLSYLNATLKSGVDLIISLTELEKYIESADVVITGEGRLDGQSYMGKAPIGVAKLAKKYNKPVIAFCGSASDDAAVCNQHGIDAFFSILKKPCSLEEAMDFDIAYNNLMDTAEQVARMLKISV